MQKLHLCQRLCCCSCNTNEGEGELCALIWESIEARLAQAFEKYQFNFSQLQYELEIVQMSCLQLLCTEIVLQEPKKNV